MSVANGRYKIISKVSLKPIDIKGGTIANGTRIIQNDDLWSYTQFWTITSVPDLADIYVIRSTPNWDMLFNVPGASQENSTPIILYTESKAVNERWRFVESNGYYKIVSVSSNKNLNVPGASTASGVDIIQYQDAGGAVNELWQLVKC